MSCVGALWLAAGRREMGRVRFRDQGTPRLVVRLGLVGLAALVTANCSGPPQVASHRRSATASVDPKYGVTASPRVVGENDPVPKGGGRQHVGRPYVIAGKTYVPRENPTGYVREGLASWYGTAFHGRLTANREIFDRHSIAAAHPTLPLPSYARVTNLANNASMIVRVNDRGPYHAGRLMDVSERVAEALDFRRVGTSRVRVEYVGKASLRGSDDTKLLATLRTDGRPASVPGQAPTMLADAGDRFESRAEPARIALAFKPEPEAEPTPAPVTERPVLLARATAPATTAYPYEPVAREMPLPGPAGATAHTPARTEVAFRPEAATVISKRTPTVIAARTTIEAPEATTAVSKRPPILVAARTTMDAPAATTVVPKRAPAFATVRSMPEGPARLAALKPASRLPASENVTRIARAPASRGSQPPAASVRVAAAPLPPGRPVDLARPDPARSSRAKVAGVY